MASKALKRAAGVAKAEAERQKLMESGLKAQRRDRERRERQSKQIHASVRGYNAELEEVLREKIITKSFELGTKVGRAEVAYDKPLYEKLRREWRDFSEGLQGSPHKKAAHDAYWEAFKAETNSRNS